MKVCIVGAGAGGRSASGRIRHLDREARIDIFSTQDEIGYAPCEPPFVLRKVASWDNIFYPGKFFEERDINVHLNTRVTGILREEKCIIAGNEKYPYDKLVLSPGAIPSIPPIPGLNGKNEFTISSNIADGRALEKILPRYTSAAILGTGAIGMEMTLTLAAMGYKKIYLLVRKSILRSHLDEDMAQILEEVITGNGVEIIQPARIEEVAGNGGKKLIRLTDRELEVDFIFLATGAKSNVALARNAGLEIGETGGILVNEYLQTSDPDIYGAGDCLELWDSITGSKTQHLMVTTAGNTGDLAARNIISGNSTPYEGVLPNFVIDIFGHKVGSLGLNERLARERGLDVLSLKSALPTSRPHLGGKVLHCKLVADRRMGTLVGAQVISEEMIRGTVSELALAIAEKIPLRRFAGLETPYSPALGRDPVLDVVRRLLSKIN